MKDRKLPLVYSCSGCSNVAQLANSIAVHLDRTGQAEMSCIAGVGAGIKPFLRLARSGREILCIDGCPHRCAQTCLENSGVTPKWHVALTDSGLKKESHRDASAGDFTTLLARVRSLLGLNGSGV